MNKNEYLQSAADRVSEVNAELAMLEMLRTAAETAKADVDAAIINKQSVLEAEKGLNAAMKANSQLDIANHALEKAESAVTAQERKVVVIGKAAAAEINNVYGLVFESCRKRNLEVLKTLYGRNWQFAEAHLNLVEEVTQASEFSFLIVGGRPDVVGGRLGEAVNDCRTIASALKQLTELADKESF